MKYSVRDRERERGRGDVGELNDKQEGRNFERDRKRKQSGQFDRTLVVQDKVRDNSGCLTNVSPLGLHQR